MAKATFRKIAKTAIIIVTIIVVIFFLMACFSPWLSPASFWWIGFAALIVPYLVLLLILAFVFFLAVKPRLTLIPLITLLVGWKQVTVIFGIHIKSEFNKTKPENSLRIVDWNIRSFNGPDNNKLTKKYTREDVAESIEGLDPDIICLQEFNNAYHPESDNISLFKKKYPYYFFSRDYHRAKGNYESGCIIFSKYAIIDSGKVKYPTAESLIYVDIVKGNDTTRIYTTHLQSFKFKKVDYDDLEKIRQQEEDALIASKNIFQKMKLAFKRRSVQANMIRDEMDKCTHPSVISGDFNDVPGSYAYFRIKEGRQDAFLQKGFGIGRSFVALAPTLRIDYILPDSHFDVLQFGMIDENLSDHIMLVSDIRLKK